MTIVDSTLREGEQTPGLVLSFKDKRYLAEELVRAGVTDLEAGIPAMGGNDRDFLRALHKDLHPRGARIINWCRAREEDLTAAFQTGTGAVHISLPASDRQLNLVGKPREWVLEELYRMAALMKRECDFLSVGAMDASRCSPEFLTLFVSTAADAGFLRIRLADTVGITSPDEIREWARLLHDYRHLLEFHGHNDLGMATANSLTAIQSGFGAVSATLLGLGERAGNAPLEELLLAIQLKLDWDGGISLSAVGELARKTARLTGERIPPGKPLLGERINRHESGIHVSGLRKDPDSFRPYDPTLWNGPAEEIIWGRQSGRNGVEHLLRSRGFDPSPDELARVTASVKETSLREEKSLTEEEIESLFLSQKRQKAAV